MAVAINVRRVPIIAVCIGDNPRLDMCEPPEGKEYY
jgi:hypothetical protein